MSNENGYTAMQYKTNTGVSDSACNYKIDIKEEYLKTADNIK